MRQYKALINNILEYGSWQENRTGVRTLSLPGEAMRFDLTEGFPAITTKKLAFKSVMGELVGFLRGYSNADQFRKLGCNIWDQNANENQEWLNNPYRMGTDDLGSIYGVQWRTWDAYKVISPMNAANLLPHNLENDFTELGVINGKNEYGFIVLHKQIDQLRDCLNTIHNNPDSRRILFHAWNPTQLDQMALPPCHLLYQFHPNKTTKELSMTMYLRSNDVGLGTPFNIAEGAALLHLFAHLTGYTAKWLNYFIGDAHIYENHMEMIKEVLNRPALPLPKLVIDNVPAYAETGNFEPDLINTVWPEDFRLEGYEYHPPIRAPMAV